MTLPTLNPETPLEQLPDLSRPIRERLAWLGIEQLRDLVERLDYQALRQCPGIGPATMKKLAFLLARAGLSFNAAGYPARTSPPRQQPENRTREQLLEQVKGWVQRQRPEVRQRWQAHQPGAYGEYLRAQLDALDHLPAPAAQRRELQHSLVLELNRYERQYRHARSPNALRKRHQATHARRGPP